jgi:hypothetical protein
MSRVFLTFCFLLQGVGLWAVEVLPPGVSSVVTENQKPWFTLRTESHKTPAGLLIREATYVGEQGVVLSKETLQLDNESQWTSYLWEELQTEERIRIDVLCHQLQFNFDTKRMGKGTKTLKIDQEEQKALVLPPLLLDYALQNWTQLMKQGRLELVLIVPERQDTFRFHFTRESPQKEGTETLVLEPNSFFVSLVVDPIKFVFSVKQGIEKADPRLMAILGLKPPIKYLRQGELVDKKTDIQF